VALSRAPSRVKRFDDLSNDQNLWMALGPGDVKERTFPRMI